MKILQAMTIEFECVKCDIDVTGLVKAPGMFQEYDQTLLGEQNGASPTSFLNDL